MPDREVNAETRVSDEKEAEVRRAEEAMKTWRHSNAFNSFKNEDGWPHEDYSAAFIAHLLDTSGVWQRIEELEREVAALDAILMDQSRGAAARAHENERLRGALREISVYGGGDGGDWVDCCDMARAALVSSPSETEENAE